MKDLLERLYEAIVVGNYPDDGSTGIAGDDDNPPGNIVYGEKYKKTNDYFNKLTNFKTQYKTDLSNWYWDEFESSIGMEDPRNYSSTLDSMEDRLPGLWGHVKRSVPDAERKADLRKMKKEIPDEPLGDEEEESAEDELDDSVILNRIDKYMEKRWKL